jgi:hypothetical protein
MKRILTEQLQVQVPVFGFAKYIGSPVTSLRDMMGEARHGNTCTAHS